MKIWFFLVLAGALVMNHPTDAQFFANLFSNIGIGRTTTTTITSTATATSTSISSSSTIITSTSTKTVFPGTITSTVSSVSISTSCTSTTTTTLIARVAELVFIDEIATLQPSLLSKQPDRDMKIDSYKLAT